MRVTNDGKEVEREKGKRLKPSRAPRLLIAVQITIEFVAFRNAQLFCLRITEILFVNISHHSMVADGSNDTLNPVAFLIEIQ